MAQVRAKEDCYLGTEHGGYKAKGDVFEYDGPKHDSLEPVKGKPSDKDKPETENQ